MRTTRRAGGIDVLSAQGVNTNRWDWQITVSTGDSKSSRIYAGAGQNDISKGTYVGDLNHSYDGSTLSVGFSIGSGFGMDETHLYAGNADTETAAPGQYGNLHDGLEGTSVDSYQLSVADDGDGVICIVAHAVVCGAFKNDTYTPTREPGRGKTPARLFRVALS